MSDETTPAFQRFMRWATTPPQAYGVYLAAVLLVFLLAFYAGTMKPRTAPNSAPPVTAPRS